MTLFWRHILLVVWKCLILRQIIVICGKCWFSSFVRGKRWLKRIESSKKSLRRCCETTCRDWFRRFKHSGFDIDDRPREGRLKTFEDADVIYSEPLKPIETITGERYWTKLMRLSRALREKRPQYCNRSSACPCMVATVLITEESEIAARLASRRKREGQARISHPWLMDHGGRQRETYKSGMLRQDQHSDGSRASRGQPSSTLGQSKGFLPLGEFPLATWDLFGAG